MSKRLQVVLPDELYAEVARAARRQRMTIAEWVRALLRAAGRRVPGGPLDRKLAAVRTASEHEFPVADIDAMLAEIEAGYRIGHD